MLSVCVSISIYSSAPVLLALAHPGIRSPALTFSTPPPDPRRRSLASPALDPLTNTRCLQLYSLYKQGTQDPPLASSPAPGMFDLAGKAKRKAWQKVVDEGVTPEQAQEKYVAVVGALKEKYGFEG